MKKSEIIMPLPTVFKGYASSYDIKVLYLEIQQYNSMKPDLMLKLN